LPTEFESLISDAISQEFSGWDFRYVATRMLEEAPSWNYRDIAMRCIAESETMLDMGTGGGEFLAKMPQLATKTYATEGYLPNISIAKARLEPLGVEVVAARGDASLPFPDETFDLVLNRHETFNPEEINRILKHGGHFVSQQVGNRNNTGLNEQLGAAVSTVQAWSLEIALAELRNYPFLIENALEEFPETVFHDVGAVVFYLKAIPWQIPGFDVRKYRAELKELYYRMNTSGGLKTYAHRFFLKARKL